MIKAKIYAVSAARALLLLFFSLLFTVFFALYIVLMVAEWYISFYSAFVSETKTLWMQYDEQLNALNKKV